jgi:hypothetical protein
VVVVGGLAIGGAGRTPLVAWLAQGLAARGLQVAVVAHDYGARLRQPEASERAVAERSSRPASGGSHAVRSLQSERATGQHPQPKDEATHRIHSLFRLRMLPVPVHVITRQFRSAFAQALWRRLRRGGPSLLPAGASARAVLDALKRNEIVVFVLDQHVPPGRAVWVPFFGRPAATDPDLVRLARASGAAVVPIFTRREGRCHPIEIQPALALELGRGEAALVEATTRCAAVVEAAIRAVPDQWLWIHRRWKPPPPDVTRALDAGRAGRRRTLRPGP